MGSGLELELDRVDGSPRDERYVDFIYQPSREADGRVSGIIVIGNDVTERQRTHHAEQRLAAIVDSSDDVILSKDLNGIITSWNGGLCVSLDIARRR